LNKILTKVIYYSIGSLLLSLGITLSIVSGLGAGAFDAQNSNLSKLLNISIGNAMYLSIFILYILSMILKPKKIYVIGLLLTGIVGFGIDTWLLVIPKINQSIEMSIIYFGSALICLPLGVTFIIQSKLPLSPMDNLLIILVEKTKWPVAIIKTLIEGSFALIALIYGIGAHIGIGALSIGTIIITFGIGPGIQFFMKFVKNIDNHEIKEVESS